MTKTAQRSTLPKAANDTAPARPTTSHADLVRIRQELAAEKFAATPRGKRLLASRR